MNNYTIIPLALACSLALSGCQTWSFKDIDELPATASLPETRVQGEVQVRYWFDQAGVETEAITTLPTYPDMPDEVDTMTTLELAESRGVNYGAMVQGLIKPPESGLYRFFVTGDDQVEFWLSDSDEPDSADLTALVPRWAGANDYSKYQSQQSGALLLEKDKFYFFRIVYKQAQAGSHFAVAWEGPSIDRQIISSPYLYSFSTSKYPDDENSEIAFIRGYAVGYFDSEQQLGYNPTYPPVDTDNDGLYDSWEVHYGLSTNNPADSSSDSDNDLLTATDEFLTGTAPQNKDSDSDGIPDGVEFAFNLVPTDPSDASGDLDGDGATNLEEYKAGTNMNDPEDVPVSGPDYQPGYTGQYFSGRNFEELILVRGDQAIDYNWGAGSPGEGIPADLFSVRWAGIFTPPHTSGTQLYEFRLTTDDGTRLYLDNNLAINQWVPRAATTNIVEIELSANDELPITVEYFESRSGARAKLEIINSLSGAALNQSEAIKTVDPTTSSDHDTDSDGIPDAWEILHGTSVMIPDGDSVLNSSGVTTLDAYTANLNPRTLEPISDPTLTAPEPGTPTPTQPPSSSVQLKWTAPGTRIDGSSIALSEIDHYEIVYGPSAGELSNTVEVESGENSYTFTDLTSGEWHFSIRVYDTDGLASEFSEPVNYTVE